MAQFVVKNFSVSIDGYGAGPGQDIDHPLGAGGMALHDWFFPTQTFQAMGGGSGGTTGPDDEIAASGFENVGAWIIGRNMFGPVRGPWPDESWRGWWGENPPFHGDVFVLTHHERAPLVTEGGTTFHFVTGGIEEAARRASAAARGKEVRVGGGVATIRQLLQAGLIERMHLAISPVLLGSGESLFERIDLAKLGFSCTQRVATPNAMHVVLSKSE